MLVESIQVFRKLQHTCRLAYMYVSVSLRLMYVIPSLYFFTMVGGTIFHTTDPASELNATVQGIMEVCAYFYTKYVNCYHYLFIRIKENGSEAYVQLKMQIEQYMIADW